MKSIIIAVLLVGTAAVALASNLTTNRTFSFDNSTGNIVTQTTVIATPALYSLTNGFFFDPVGGNFCSEVTTSLPTPYQVCSNLVWGESNQYTNRVCATVSSNSLVTGRFRIGGAYPVTNRAAAVKAGP